MLAQISDGKNEKSSLAVRALLWTVEDQITEKTQRSQSFRSSSGHAWIFL